jgi:signal transduction histidine kinase
VSIKSPVNKIKTSIFIKILIIILLSYIVMIYCSVTTHRAIFKRTKFKKHMENSVNLCRYIIDDIGIPPDTALAARNAREMNINMRIITDLYTWSSPPDMKQLDPAELHDLEFPHVRAGYSNGIQMEIERRGILYQFMLARRRESMPYAMELVMILQLLYILVLLGLIYLALRWQLAPLGLLHSSVQRMAEGELDFKIDSKRKDELGVLIRSFNSMRAEILKMIKARDQLLLDVSHELRSPLTRMRVSLEMMEEGEDRDDLIEDINELELMITEILEGARMQGTESELNIQEVDLGELIEDVASEFQDRQPGVELHTPGERIKLPADRARLRILFNNIISNAVKYSPSQGKPVEVDIGRSDKNITVTVRDHGPGIPREELPLIFEPFYRVDKSRSKQTGGYGLGMHLSKRIMDAHGGDIDIQSEEGKGTVVKLKLPIFP